MFNSRHRAAIAALVCACVFAACDDPPEKTDVAAPGAPAKAPASKAPSIGKDMVAAVSSAQSSSVIGVHFALRATPTVNAALPVDVAIVPHRDYSSLIVHFDSQDGLAVTIGNVLGPKTDLGVEVPVTHQLVLLPTKEGMFMVNAVVDTEGADGNTTRVFSMPVIVSATPAAPPSAPAAAPEPAAN
jgi:hypothetical protein